MKTQCDRLKRQRACCWHTTIRLLSRIAVLVVLALIPLKTLWGDERIQPQTTDLSTAAPRFLKTFCIDCHRGDAPDGGLSLDKLETTLQSAEQIERWKLIYEKLENQEMPPSDAEQPDASLRVQFLQQIKRGLKDVGSPIDETKSRSSRYANRVDHRSLFSGQVQGDPAIPSRVWRVSEEAYLARLKRFNTGKNRNKAGIPSPWQIPAQWSFPDYSVAHRIGEPEMEIHLRTSSVLAQHIIDSIGKNKELTSLKEFADSKGSASSRGVRSVVEQSFKYIIGSDPTKEERERYEAFLKERTADAGARSALHDLIVVVLSHPTIFYRIESAPGGKSRAQMEAGELARAIALTLTDREPDTEFTLAVVRGKLATRDEVRFQVDRILSNHEIGKPRIAQFFREYFGYAGALSVFKDEATVRENGLVDWDPSFFVVDADRLVESIVHADQNVLRELLTTRKTYVLSYDSRWSSRNARNTQRFINSPADSPFKPSMKVSSVLATYELDLKTRGDWDPEKLYDLPSEHRMGILTHPAWLVAQSSNFDNHAIHRGRWIREKLLGGLIPDVPITVNAMLPEEPHNTLRERMRVTQAEYCWKCHRLMDPLGLAFEQFDHFGRFRKTEQVLAAAGKVENRDKESNKKSNKKTFRQAKMDTTGEISDSIDPTLDGPVKNPFELIEKLSTSTVVEQVFVRHAFRFFLGRNETLADGPTLVAAHQEYRDKGGSLRALLTSLLTSDSFLYRSSELQDSTN